jgi:glyoxylase-like metal-dependent hydrolase (beta-lactamase superfamily II)
MDSRQRLDRREWLAKVGATAAGAGGLVLAIGGGRKLGVIGRPAQAAGKSSQAVRVNLGFVSAYIVTRGDVAALVDTGVAGSTGAIGDVLQGTGLGWDNLQHLILTHHHPDHQGSAPDVIARARNALVWAGPADIPMIRVEREVRAANDGAEIFGLRVVATPGHTLGHISLLDPELGTLIIGDAVINTDNMLTGSPPMFTADPAAANASVRKIGGLAFEQALFGHGDPIERGAAAAIAGLGASLP